VLSERDLSIVDERENDFENRGRAEAEAEVEQARQESATASEPREASSTHVDGQGKCQPLL
jgi:hypothetical protein